MQAVFRFQIRGAILHIILNIAIAQRRRKTFAAYSDALCIGLIKLAGIGLFNTFAAIF
jgi:hypothetical protein